MSKTLVIAEIGANFDQNFDQAKALIDVAVKSGSDVCKFQTYTSHKIFAKQTKVINGIKDVRGLFKSIEIDRDWQKDLKTYSDEKGIEFMSTPFDEDAIQELVDIGVKRMKISGFESTDPRFVEAVASTGLPIIMSAGIGFRSVSWGPFAEIFKNRQPSSIDLSLDLLMNSQQIFGTGFFSFGETNDGGISSALPIYKTVFANSESTTLCYNNINGAQNKLGNINYVIFEPQVAGNYIISVVTENNLTRLFDFDLSIIKSGSEIAYNNDITMGNTSISASLSAEKHIIKVSVWDPDGYIARGNYCFDLQVTTN